MTTHTQTQHEPNSSIHDAAMVDMLSRRYGDGFVYLPKGAPKGLYTVAITHQLLSQEGYLTRKGRILLARHRR